jgi:hypothetical protein
MPHIITEVKDLLNDLKPEIKALKCSEKIASHYDYRQRAAEGIFESGQLRLFKTVG